MRLNFIPSNQIFFKKTSNQKMKGLVEIRNPSSKTIFSYKIKCTNPSLFIVNPIKSTIKPGQSNLIQFNTVDSVNLQSAKHLVSNHQFLIEFVPIASEYAIANFKSQQAQRKKYHINMDNIRMTQQNKLFRKDNNEIQQEKQSEKQQINSQKSNLTKNYYSMKNYQQSTKEYQCQADEQDKMMLKEKHQQINEQLQLLIHEKRQLVSKLPKTQGKIFYFIKRFAVFMIFFVIGYLVGYVFENYIEIQQILNFQQQKQKSIQSQPSWSFMDFLQPFYDYIDFQHLKSQK